MSETAKAMRDMGKTLTDMASALEEATERMVRQQEENARVYEIISKTPLEWRLGLPYAEQRILCEYVGQTRDEFLTDAEAVAEAAYE